jgi:hypothetical protein
MVTIDENVLSVHGIQVPAENVEMFLNQIRESVEEQVGLALIGKLSDDDAKAAIELSKNGNEAQVTSWLQSHLPNYEEVVQQEVNTILDNIAAKQAK